jgi:1-acyl-sn-glycerol-3-phosphate acyltransferase
MVFPRQLIAVASEHPFKSRIARFGMKFFGAIQANREIKDMSFIEKSAEVIHKGKLVQIFPEARNTPDGKMHEFKPSYVLISNMADCKILPIITDGNYGLFKRVSIIIGKEFHLSEIIESKSAVLTKEEIQEANKIIYQRALDLRAKLEELKNQRKKNNG